MSLAPDFPHDANGEVLRSSQNQGDDLSRSRIVDFCFVFPLRQQAIAFAEIVDEPVCEVCISYYKERSMWQTIVKTEMIPTHGAITS